MPKRKVGPLPSANNSFVNTLMNRYKFMKKIRKYRNLELKLQALNIMKTNVFSNFYL